MKKKEKKVFVAMSGGVDSSVAAYLLLEQGYEVEGVTMRLGLGPDQTANAEKVAKQLKIKHRFVDVQEEFEKRVIDYFCREYRSARTPNPCVQCNKNIKFGILMDLAVRENAFFSTGHYARIVFNAQEERFELKKACDLKKDQSYVLFLLKQKQLSRILLPLGELNKDRTKAIAEKLGLPVNESESQDICFISHKHYAEFMEERDPDFDPRPGDIVLRSGKVVGRHKGIIFYTIGQRKGLGIAYKDPLFVLGFDPENNRVIVGEESELYQDGFEVEESSFTDEGFSAKEFRAEVKIRYNNMPHNALIVDSGKGVLRVRFDAPQKSVTPGQAAVFYEDDRVIGGGIISRLISF